MAAKIGCQARLWLRETNDLDSAFPTICRDLGQAAYAGVEMGFAYVKSPADPDKYRRLAERHALTIAGIHVGGAWYDAVAASERALPQAQAAADFARQVGAPYLIISTGRKRDGTLSPAELESQASALATLCAYTREHGVMPLLHNHEHEFADGGRIFSHLMASLDANTLGLCLDINWAMWAGADGLKLLQDYYSRLRVLHIRDTVGSDHCVEVMGEGDADLAALLGVLRERDYPHWVIYEWSTPEPATSRSTAELAPANYAYLARALGIG